MNDYGLCVINMNLPDSSAETLALIETQLTCFFFFLKTEKINFTLALSKRDTKQSPLVFPSPQSPTLLSVLLINTRQLIQSNNLWAFLGRRDNPFPSRVLWSLLFVRRENDSVCIIIIIIISIFFYSRTLPDGASGKRPSSVAKTSFDWDN